MPAARSVFFNGTLLTMEASEPRAEAIALSGDGRIVAVGAWSDVEPLVGAGTRRIDLEGRTLLPGFNDAHAHVWKVGQLLTSLLDVRSARSVDELTALIRRRHRELPESAWIVGRGYNEALLREGRHPTRHDFDDAAPGRPVAMTRTCGHMLVVSTAALERAGVNRNTPAPAGGAIARDEHGEPTGRLEETAMGLVKAVMPDPSADEYADMVETANTAQLRKGITSATEAGAYPDVMAAYRKLERDGRLRVRANVMAMRLSDEMSAPFPLPETFVSDALRIDSVKLFADGGLSGATAALSQSYRHATTQGLLRIDVDTLFDLAAEARDAGLKVCTHAIGDAAIELVLDVYERLDADAPRIEHCGLPDRAQLARAKRVGAVVVAQTVFIEELGVNFRRYLTDDYLARCYPVRSMLDAGLVVALSSDAPVVADDNPFLGIRAAITRRDREGEHIAANESIDVEEALFAYTMGGALASGDSNNRGSLVAGKWADVVVLDRDPLEVEPDALDEIQVVETYVGGEMRYSS